MVKVTLRKSTKHLTPVEKLLSLEQNRRFNRSHVNFLNRRENVHLAKRYSGYEQNKAKRMRDILRTKDQMKLNLIELDYSRRKAATMCEFEQRLRTGNCSPVFLKEHLKLLQKEEELSILQNRLNGPNSQIVADHLREELRAINDRIEISNSSGRITDQNAAVNYARSDQTNAYHDNIKYEEVEAININGATQKKNVEDGSPKLDVAADENGEESIAFTQQHTQNLKCGNMITNHAEMELNLANSSEEQDLLSGDFVGPASLLSRSDSFFPITSSLSKKGSELPPLKVKNRQKHCHFVVHRSHRPRQSPISPTYSARKRAKHAQKRVTELTEKTKVDMKKDECMRRRKDVETPRDSLKGIKQAETIARLSVARKGITLPDIKSTMEPHRQPRRSRTVDSSIKLPELKVDRDLVSELRLQRYKHRTQSTSFPQLP